MHALGLLGTVLMQVVSRTSNGDVLLPPPSHSPVTWVFTVGSVLFGRRNPCLHACASLNTRITAKNRKGGGDTDGPGLNPGLALNSRIPFANLTHHALLNTCVKVCLLTVLRYNPLLPSSWKKHAPREDLLSFSKAQPITDSDRFIYHLRQALLES